MENKNSHAPFRVYNASAGAGKTFALVKDYLKICLSSNHPNRFKQILAITFTNKAAAEMKLRVLTVLETVAGASAPDSHPMIKPLLKELHLSFETLQERAQAVLHSMLHNYSLLGISTIDTFTNKLIRSFSRELQLSANYEVELDVKSLLQDAVQLLLENLREGQADTRILKGFLQQRMREEKSPKIERDVVELMQQVYYDDHSAPYLQQLKAIDNTQFIEIEGKLRRERETDQKKLAQVAQQALMQVESYGIDEVLYQGNGKVPTILNKIAGGKRDYLTRTKTMREILNGDKDFYPKSKAKKAAPFFDPISEELRQLLCSTDYKLKKMLERLELWDKIQQNFYATAVIREVEAYLEMIKESTNVLPIGEFNRLISAHISGQPAPFLYEKLGERYHHFFIDEFQDTNHIQWQNLVPLVNNALAGGEHASAVIVGDAKQAIYRFRGGEAEQFMSIARNVENSNKVKVNEDWRELYSREEFSLGYNFRSRQNVVAFNNHFFEFCSHYEPLPEGHKLLYAAARQEAQGAEGGYVELTLYNIDQDEQQEETLAKVKSTIEDCRRRGFTYRDICILVRNKSQIEILSFYLRQEGIPFVGSDSLRLSQSSAVRGLISMLQMLEYPQDEQVRIPFLELLFVDMALPDQEHFPFMKKWGKASLHSLWHFIEEQKSAFNRQTFEQAGAYQRISSMLCGLDEVIYDNPYLQKFLDEVLALQERYGPALRPVTDWWQQKGWEVSISLPENTDAVRLDTIHKSKGLEFPVVLIPFANWGLFGKKTYGWLPLNAQKSFGLPCAYIKLKRITEDIMNEEIVKITEREAGLQLVDNLNLLYVAMTRAVDELYIMAKAKKDYSLELLFQNYLKEQNEEALLTRGNKVMPKQNPEEAVAPQNILNTQHYRPRRQGMTLPISSSAPAHWRENTARTHGRMVHHILSVWQAHQAPEILLGDMQHSGIIDASEAAKLEPILQAILQHGELQTFFGSDTGKVLQERDILLPEGGTQRPDRVVLEGEVAHVLDYKTGAPRQAHREQVEAYMHLLQQMGYRPGERALVYLDDAIQVEKW